MLCCPPHKKPLNAKDAKTIRKGRKVLFEDKSDINNIFIMSTLALARDLLFCESFRLKLKRRLITGELLNNLQCLSCILEFKEMRPCVAVIRGVDDHHQFSFECLE